MLDQLGSLIGIAPRRLDVWVVRGACRGGWVVSQWYVRGECWVVRLSGSGCSKDPPGKRARRRPSYSCPLDGAELHPAGLRMRVRPESGIATERDPPGAWRIQVWGCVAPPTRTATRKSHVKQVSPAQHTPKPRAPRPVWRVVGLATRGCFAVGPVWRLRDAAQSEHHRAARHPQQNTRKRQPDRLARPEPAPPGRHTPA